MARKRKRSKPASSHWLKRSPRVPSRSQSAIDSRQGIILLIVLLVVASISLGALAYSRSMLSGHQESVLLGESIQSRNAAESAIDAARLFLASSRLERDEAGGTYNNPSTFQAIPVLQGRMPGNVCNYSLVAPELDEAGRFAGIRFGLINESSKLNVNVLPLVDSQMSLGQIAQQMMPGMDAMGLGAAMGASGAGAGAGGGAGSAGGATQSDDQAAPSGIGRTLLMALPGMTEDIADSILDFIDEDDEAREYGAERDYYSTLPAPYAPNNGPLQSIEQLLLVRGVSPDLLFGFDQNRNGVLDPAEESAAATMGLSTGTSGADSSEGTTIPPLGWAAYLTVYSKEKNVQQSGDPRININSQDVATLQTDLEAAVGADIATFIIAYRYMANSQQQAGGAGMPGGAAMPGGGMVPGGDQGGGGRGRDGGGPGRDGGGRGGRGEGGGGPGGGSGGGGGPGRGNGPGGGAGGGPGGGPGGGAPRGGGRGPIGFATPNDFLASGLLASASVFIYPNSLTLTGYLQRGGQGVNGQPPGGGNAGGFGGGQGGPGRGGQGGPAQGGPGRGGQGGPAQGGPGRGGDGGQGQGGPGDNGRGNGRGNGRPGGGGDMGMGGGMAVGGGMGMGGGGGTTRRVKWSADMMSQLNIDTANPPSGTIRQVLDLIGAEFTATINNEQVTITSPLENSPIAMALYLPMIMDKLTAVTATIMPGRININEAPREILAGLPGMTEEILEALIESRGQSADNENRKFETWPMVEGIISLDQMKIIAPLITAGGDCMRVQAIGYFEQSSGFSRIEAVIDASGQLPVLVMYRKLDHLGRGFSQSTLGQRALMGVVQ